MTDTPRPRRRNRRSKLDTPDIVRFIRNFATRRIASDRKLAYSYHLLALQISAKFSVSAHKTTVRDFVHRLGLAIAWEA